MRAFYSYSRTFGFLSLSLSSSSRFSSSLPFDPSQEADSNVEPPYFLHHRRSNKLFLRNDGAHCIAGRRRPKKNWGAGMLNSSLSTSRRSFATEGGVTNGSRSSPFTSGTMSAQFKKWKDNKSAAMKNSEFSPASEGSSKEAIPKDLPSEKYEKNKEIFPPCPAQKAGKNDMPKEKNFPVDADQFRPPGENEPEMTEEERKQKWKSEVVNRYGEGNYHFFCSLYKELCEEMKRELYTKPPTAFRSTPSSGASSEASQNASASSSATASSFSPSAFASTPPVKTEGSPAWKVQYYSATNTLVFERSAVHVPSTGSSSSFSPSISPSFISNTPSAAKLTQEAAASAHVWAYAKVHITDPPKINALLLFVDWCAIEVFIERNDVILHFSIASNEGGMHMRNVRVYDANMRLDAPLALQKRAEDTAGGRGNAMRTTKKSATSQSQVDDSSLESNAAPNEAPTVELKRGESDSSSNETVSPTNAFTTSPPTIRDIFTGDSLAGPGAFETVRHWFYDGPCLWHMELEFQNELYDLLQDYDITLDWVRWASDWVFYYEHRITTQWMCNVLLDLIPAHNQGVEKDFLTEEEQAYFDEPASDWVREPLA